MAVLAPKFPEPEASRFFAHFQSRRRTGMLFADLLRKCARSGYSPHVFARAIWGMPMANFKGKKVFIEPDTDTYSFILKTRDELARLENIQARYISPDLISKRMITGSILTSMKISPIYSDVTNDLLREEVAWWLKSHRKNLMVQPELWHVLVEGRLKMDGDDKLTAEGGTTLVRRKIARRIEPGELQALRDFRDRATEQYGDEVMEVPEIDKVLKRLSLRPDRPGPI